MILFPLPTEVLVWEKGDDAIEKTSSPAGGLSPAIKRATLLPLIGITYCMVAGGPYALEDVVKGAGYRNAILLLLITPLLWAFPVTLMVSELSTAFPEDGGYYVWVRRAMGPFWGFQEAWLSFAASIFDMALYPTAFVLYLSMCWPAASGFWMSTAIGVGLIVLCVGVNFAGIRSVGAGSLLMTLAMLLPFVVMIALAFTHPSQAPRPSTTAIEKTGWLTGFLAVMWNYMGWDNASTIAGEVERPQRNYPLAMLVTVLLTAVTYIIPVAAASRSGIAPADWQTGSWVDTGRAIGNVIGPRVAQGLAIAITTGGMISAFSMFNSLILSYSRVPIAMVEDGFLPKVMGLRLRRSGAPWVSILFCAVGWGLCMKLGFDKLLLLDTSLYGLSLILEFAALIVLRIREPGLPRPYKVPGGLIGCTLIAGGPLAIMGVAFYEGLSDDTARKSLIVAGIVTVAGVALYYFAVWVNPQLRAVRLQSQR